MCHYIRQDHTFAPPSYRSRTAFSLLLTLLTICSLLSTACNASETSNHAQTAAAPAPINTTITDTAGCPATSGKTLYVPSASLISEGSHTQFITALDERGRKVWQQQHLITNANLGIFTTSNGNLFYLFVNSTKKDTNSVGSYDGKDGHQRWELQAFWNDQLFGCNDIVYLIGGKGIQARSAHDGRLLWQQAGYFLLTQRLPQVVSQKALVLIDGTQSMNAQDIDVLDAKTGKLLWKHPYPFEIHGYSPDYAVVSNQAVYVIKQKGNDMTMLQVEKLSLGNGQPFWNTSLRFSHDEASDFVVENGMAYVIGTLSLITLYAQSGKLAWQDASVGEVKILNGNVYSRKQDSQRFCAREGTTGKQLWCTSFNTYLPEAGNTAQIYSTDGYQVFALRISDGRTLWTWTRPDESNHPSIQPSIGDMALG